MVGNPKMTFIFILGYPNPRKGALRGVGLGGLQGVLSPILPNIMCYVNSGVLNSGKSKNDLHFHFRVPLTPASIINKLGQRKDFFPLTKKGLE